MPHPVWCMRYAGGVWWRSASARAAGRFFQHGAKRAPPHTERRMEAPCCTDVRAARRHTPIGYYPNLARTIVKFICACLKYAIALGDRARHGDFLVLIPPGIRNDRTDGFVH